MKTIIYTLLAVLIFISCEKNEIEEISISKNLTVDSIFLNGTIWESLVFSYNSNHVVQKYTLIFDSIGNNCKIIVGVEKDSIRRDFNLKEGNYILNGIRLLSDVDTLTFLNSVVSKNTGLVVYNNKGKCFGFFKK